MNKFKPPDEAALARMTPASIEALIETLKDQRAAKVKDIDIELAYYFRLLKDKKSAKATR